MPSILIIDKEEVIGSFYASECKDLGIGTAYTTKFDSALVLLSIEYFDAVILDPTVRDANGKLNFDKGIKIAREIKRKYKIPVIIVAASLLRDYDLQEFDGFVIKSSDLTELKLRIREVLCLDKFPHGKLSVHPNKKIKIFICYAKEDFAKSFAIYEILKQEKYNPWIDEENLLPGQNWELEIEKIIETSDFFLACLSTNSVNKEGYVQKELKAGFEICDRQPEDSIYLIPVRLDDCPVPQRLKKLHWCNFFEHNGRQKLLESVKYGCQIRKRL